MATTSMEPPRNAVLRIRLFIQKGLGNAARNPSDHVQYMYDEATGQAHLTLFGRAFAFASQDKYEADAKEGVHRAALCRDILHTILKSVPAERIEKFDLERIANEWQSMATLGPLPSKLEQQQQQQQQKQQANLARLPSSLSSASGPHPFPSPSSVPTYQPAARQPIVSQTPPAHHLASSSPSSPYSSRAPAASHTNPASISPPMLPTTSTIHNPQYQPASTAAASASPALPVAQSPRVVPQQPRRSGVQPVLPPKVPALTSYPAAKLQPSSPSAPKPANTASTTRPRPAVQAAQRSPVLPAHERPLPPVTEPPPARHVERHTAPVAVRSPPAPAPSSTDNQPSTTMSSRASIPPAGPAYTSTSASSPRNGIGLQKDSSRAFLTQERSYEPDFHNPNEVEAWRDIMDREPPDNAVDRIRWLSEAHLSRCKKPDVYKPYLDFSLDENPVRLVVARAANPAYEFRLREEENYLLDSQAGRGWIQEELARLAIKEGALKSYIKKKMPKVAVARQVHEVIKRYSDMRYLRSNRQPSPPHSMRSNGYKQRGSASQPQTPSRAESSASTRANSPDYHKTPSSATATTSNTSRSLMSQSQAASTALAPPRASDTRDLLDGRDTAVPRQRDATETSRRAEAYKGRSQVTAQAWAGHTFSEPTEKAAQPSQASTITDTTTSQDVPMDIDTHHPVISRNTQKPPSVWAGHTISQAEPVLDTASNGQGSLAKDHSAIGVMTSSVGISNDTMPLGSHPRQNISQTAHVATYSPIQGLQEDWSVPSKSIEDAANAPTTSGLVSEVSQTAAAEPLPVAPEQPRLSLLQRSEVARADTAMDMELIAGHTTTERIVNTTNSSTTNTPPAPSLSERMALQSQDTLASQEQSSLLSRLQAERATAMGASKSDPQRKLTLAEMAEKVGATSLFDRLSDREAELRRRIGVLRRGSAPDEARREIERDSHMQVDASAPGRITGLPSTQTPQSAVASGAADQSAAPAATAASQSSPAPPGNASYEANAPQESVRSVTAGLSASAGSRETSAAPGLQATSSTASLQKPAQGQQGRTPPPRTTTAVATAQPRKATSPTTSRSTAVGQAAAAQASAPAVAKARLTTPPAGPRALVAKGGSTRTMSLSTVASSSEATAQQEREREPASARPRSGSVYSTTSHRSRDGQRDFTADDVRNKRRRDSTASYTYPAADHHREEEAEAKRRRRESPPGHASGASRSVGRADSGAISPSDLYSKTQKMTSIITKLSSGALSYDQACEAMYALHLPASMDSDAFDALEAVWSNSSARLFEKASVDFNTSDLVLMPKSWVQESLELLQERSEA